VLRPGPSIVPALSVALGARSYPIHVGAGLLARSGELLAALPSRHVVVVTNPTVAQHHLAPLQRALAAASLRHDVVIVADGEQHKDWATLHQIHTRLLELGADRSTTLLALGGGVIGDLAGFAAATYQRGVPLVQAPTTLLAQVDSSVGGKTAVNHPLGKNMIGAFHQPLLVISDTDTLRTLPQREYVAGIAEIIKCGAVRERALFEWLEANMERLLARDPAAIAHAVIESCRIKADIVAADEHERGERALLNFGHTFAHAIEAGTGYGSWLHGEAVAAGMIMAARLSQRVTGLAAPESERLYALVVRAGLPVLPPSLPLARWLELMLRDKKRDQGAMRFVLLRALGSGAVGGAVPEHDLRAVLSF
jgi:3-dehydroquinate synthase